MEKGLATVLWTGGKDSCLALHEAKKEGYKIAFLTTFIPKDGCFKAHPISLMEVQSEALRLSLKKIVIEPPFRESYCQAIRHLYLNERIKFLITGDIDEVDEFPNWIRECSEGTGVNVLTPLWRRNRRELLDQMLEYRMDIRFSCIRNPFIPEDWLFKKLDLNIIDELENLHRTKGVDICGENGEYHTVVLDAKLFQKQITLKSYLVRKTQDTLYADLHVVATTLKTD